MELSLVGLIHKKYCDSCRLRSPLTKGQYAKAKKASAG